MDHYPAAPRRGIACCFPFLLALGLMLSPARANAATYHVAPNGLDTNNGSQAAPFRQIRRGVRRRRKVRGEAQHHLLRRVLRRGGLRHSPGQGQCGDRRAQHGNTSALIPGHASSS